jgi:plasmid replication initiation protein
MASTLNKAETKKRLLDLSRRIRHGMFTRVSKKAMDQLEAMHMQNMYEMVRRHRSVGKTIDP